MIFKVLTTNNQTLINCTIHQMGECVVGVTEKEVLLSAIMNVVVSWWGPQSVMPLPAL